MDADQEKRWANMKAWREEMDAEMEAIRARTKARQVKMMEGNFTTCRKETVACQEMTEANPEEEEPSPQEITRRIEKTQVELPTVEASLDPLTKKLEEKSERQEIPKEGAAVASLECEEQGPKKWESGAERREVPTEKAAVKSSRISKKRPRGLHIAAGRRVRPTKLIRGDCESRRKLVAACKKVSRCAAVAWSRRNIFRDIRTQGNFGPRDEVTAAGKTMTLCAGLARRKGTFVRDIRTQRNGGPRKKLAAAGRMMTRFTVTAQRKEHGLQKKEQDDMSPRTGKECTCRLKSWKDPADGIGIKYPGGRGPRDLRKERTTTNGIGVWKSGPQLLPGSGRMHMKALYEMRSVKIAKQNAGTCARMRSIKD
jgi:hypothetical protein